MSSTIRPAPERVWIQPREPFNFCLETGTFLVLCWDCERLIAEGKFTLTLDFPDGRKYTFADTRAVAWCHSAQCNAPNTLPRLFETAAEAMAFANTEKERYQTTATINYFDVVEYVPRFRPPHTN